MLYFLFLFAFVYAGDKALQPQITANKTALKHIKPVSKSQNLLDNVILDPKKFVAEVAKLDPVALRTIITLLEELLTTSEQRETQLNGDVSDANAAVNAASNAVANAEGALDDAIAGVTQAQADLEEVERQAAASIAAAEGVLAQTQQDQSTAQGVLDDAKSDHANKVSDKEDAEGALSGEADSLDHEQQVLREVIAILEGLHGDASTRLEEQYWDLVGGVVISDGVASSSEASADGGYMVSKTTYSRPLEVSWTSKMVDTRGDECVVMDVFPQNTNRHSGYSMGFGWWSHYLGWGIDNAQGHGVTEDGDISVNHVYKLVLTDTEVIWYADDVEYHREANTQYMSGTIRVGNACRGWETSDVTVTPL